MELKVSIAIITYNQEQYVQEMLNNIVSQVTDFKFEAIVSDDCSTDKTPEIIKEYANRYPDIIKPLFREKNIGVIRNYLDTLNLCDAEFVAICEGDDYWCDPYKLQKQVDFMEAHLDYALCYHPAKMIYVDEEHKPIIIGLSKNENPQSYYELIKANNIPANSVMYRAEYLKQELLKYPNDIYPPDWFTHISVAKHGKIGYLPDVMYVYRWHSQGISHTTSDNSAEEIHLKYGIKEVNFSYAVWNKIKDQFPQYYSDIFIPVLEDVYFAYLKAQKFEEINTLTNIYSNYFKDFELCTENKEVIKYKKKHKKYKKLFNLLLFTTIALSFICAILTLFILSGDN